MTIMVVMGDGILQVLSAYRQLFLNSRALTEGGQVLSPSSPSTPSPSPSPSPLPLSSSSISYLLSLIGYHQAGSAVFPLFSLINHSCAPNTITMVGLDRKLQVMMMVVMLVMVMMVVIFQVRAQEDIAIGNEVTTRYGGLNIGQVNHHGDGDHFACTQYRPN